MAGHFTGKPQFEFLDEGRRMKLLCDYGYVDGAGIEWPVKEGATVDGASIPQLLWGIVGGPFEQAYRNASVVHDWYCAIRTRPWESVHRMFFEAMLDSHVSPGKAKLMYLAVRYAGPRWSDMDVANTNLATGGGLTARGLDTFDPDGDGADTAAPDEPPAAVQPRAIDLDEFRQLAKDVAASDASPDDIEALTQ